MPLIKDIKKFFKKDTKSKIKFWRNAVKPRKGAPPKIKKWIEENKNKNIGKIVVCRKPVQGAIKGVLNFVSKGKFNKSLKGLRYEDIFHLYLYITVGNKTWRIEKNAVVELTVDNRSIKENCMEIDLSGKTIKEKVRRKPKYQHGLFFANPIRTETKTTYVPAKWIKLGVFMKEGEKYQKNFWSYNAAGNNCQNFVESLLVGNKLIKKNTKIHKFIKQDSAAIFKNNTDSFETIENMQNH